MNTNLTRSDIHQVYQGLQRDTNLRASEVINRANYIARRTSDSNVYDAMRQLVTIVRVDQQTGGALANADGVAGYAKRDWRALLSAGGNPETLETADLVAYVNKVRNNGRQRHNNQNTSTPAYNGHRDDGYYWRNGDYGYHSDDTNACGCNTNNNWDNNSERYVPINF
jgi:hypothetical protein